VGGVETCACEEAAHFMRASGRDVQKAAASAAAAEAATA